MILNIDSKELACDSKSRAVDLDVDPAHDLQNIEYIFYLNQTFTIYILCKQTKLQPALFREDNANGRDSKYNSKIIQRRQLCF